MNTATQLSLMQLNYQQDTADEQAVIHFVNQLLQHAADNLASDIHLEPYEQLCRIRIRIDGRLHTISELPTALAPRFIARLKVLAQLDIAEKRLPQDGRIRLNLSGNQLLDCRISTLPVAAGEKVVLRLLNPDATLPPPEQLGMTTQQLQLFLQYLSRPQGMILVTGPTGSGKTITLYSALQQINQPDINISAAEDPIEMMQPGINQLQIHPRIGLNFATALRTFLRQDPDVIMVGEIRDTETAEIAIKAAQTGHLVLSTLHTNSAWETLNRLQQMGVPLYQLVSTVSLVIAQRLVRCLCPQCRIPQYLDNEKLQQQGFSNHYGSSLQLYTASSGCRHCLNGYRGRTGIYELMPVSSVVAAEPAESAQQLQYLLQQQNITSLRQAALQKAALGITSLQEVNRVTGIS